MQTINFLSPTFKAGSVIAGVSSAAIGGLYLTFGSAAIVPMTAVATISTGVIIGTSYYSRNIIDYMYSSLAIKCDENHPLTKSAREVVKLNPDFINLDKVDIYLTSETTPNAFACGFTKNDAAIYVTNGLVNSFENKFSDLRVKAILAHELGHIAGSHIQINTAVKVLDVVSDVAILAINKHFSDSSSKTKKHKKDEKYKNDKSDSDSSSLVIEGAIWVGLKLFKNFGLSFISRQLEYEADKAAQKSGLGHELMEALLKISHTSFHNSFFNGLSSFTNEFFMTHPSVINRLIAIDFAVKEDSMKADKNSSDSILKSIQYSIGRVVLETTSHFNQMTILSKIMPDYVEKNGYNFFKNDSWKDSFYDFTKNSLVGEAKCGQLNDCL